jgi:tRNA 2-thiouridine synthesizing protein A
MPTGRNHARRALTFATVRAVGYSRLRHVGIWGRRVSRRRSEPSVGGPAEADVAWDAGDLGCGELVLQLKLRLDGMAPGQLMKLVARDPGVPADLPAWCRLTGHRLVAADHPVYLIRRKER